MLTGIVEGKRLIEVCPRFRHFCCVQQGGADKTMTASRQAMKDLLADGYEIRSHQFFRCTATPEKDDAYSCVNVLMQKGKKFATCNFDRNKFLFEGPPIAPSCAVFE